MVNANKPRIQKKKNPIAFGILMGVAMGSGIGLVVGNLAIGMGVGISFGFAFGVALQRKKVMGITNEKIEKQYH